MNAYCGPGIRAMVVPGKAEVARVEKTIKETLDHAQWLMVCGSIPPGVPTTFYGRLISAARKKKMAAAAAEMPT